MDPTKDEVTLDEFKQFYKIDRDLYTILVRDLCLNPSKSMHIMGFWLWLERASVCSIIRKILSLTAPMINQLAEEALICLMIVSNQLQETPEPAFEIPLTRILIPSEISLQYLHENRLKVSSAIQSLVSCVYIPALSDIMEIASHAGSVVTSSVQSLIPPAASGSSGEFSPVYFGECSIDVQPEIPIHPPNPMMIQVSDSQPSMDSIFQSFSNMSITGDISTVNSGTTTSRYTRTMFVTFSKGYPVTEHEVREFFTKQFGNCIESFHMQEVRSDKQALYARIVFHTASIIHIILNGGDKAKFTINGKHVWMRKFVPRNAIAQGWVPHTTTLSGNNS